ncbi:MAG TPA: phosphoribosyl-ATP diphosphatase [Aquificae bacterium]|nr:phosphoribosyl-ATP diphosphatase [Aquificota bacterium]
MFLKDLEEILKRRIEEFKERKDLSSKELKKISYTMYILKKGYDKIIQKFGEEAIEVLIEFKNKDKEKIIYEVADLLYFLTLLLKLNDLSWDDVLKELENRHGKTNKNT